LISDRRTRAYNLALDRGEPLVSTAPFASARLVLPGDLAKKIAQKIWLNETGGKSDAITSWNANEEFASLGIGHFIWFPVGKWLPFEETFPALLEFMRKKNVHLPAWLDQTCVANSSCAS
jgi:hypothetical protein